MKRQSPEKSDDTRMGKPCAMRLALGLLLACGNALAFDTVTRGNLTLEPSAQLRFGAQHGTGINFGYGATDVPGERKRDAFAASIEPRLGASWDLSGSTLYGGVSVAAATTGLDGEIAGNFARSGDAAMDTDEAHLGWRNDTFDLSVGAQPYAVGDGLLIADGNFDTGARDGNYWVVPFESWRNSAILKVNTEPVRGEVFWLRSDRDFGDSRMAGVNLETTVRPELGKLGFMYFEVLEGDRVNYDGLNVWDFRATDVPVPGVPNLLLYGELVRQVGTDADAQRENDAWGWHLEGQYHFPNLFWTPTISLRYARFSGDDPETPENDGYRAMFYTFYIREWDTWYMGEIAGEYHLFNANQISKMYKFELVPREDIHVTLYYYRHDLEEKNYFGVPLSSSDWADELNLGIEYFGEKVFAYAGLVWSTPDKAASEFFGNDDDFTVIQTWMSYRF